MISISTATLLHMGCQSFTKPSALSISLGFRPFGSLVPRYTCVPLFIWIPVQRVPYKLQCVSPIKSGVLFDLLPRVSNSLKFSIMN